MVLATLAARLPGTRLDGLELDETALGMARVRCPGATLVRGDACALPFGDRSFDLVVCLEVLEHLPEPMRALRELRRVAGTGCLLSVPHEPFFRLGNLLRGKNVTRLGDPTDHVQHWGARGFAEFCGRELAIRTIRDHGIPVHERGTVVVIQGPRFSTKSESRWFMDAGWEVINMTQFPEAWLCRELGMAVVNISLITDYDAGVIEGTEAVDAHSVLEVFAANAERIQKVVLDLIGRFPADLDALGARDALGPTRGDGHTISPEDIRLFETGF